MTTEAKAGPTTMTRHTIIDRLEQARGTPGVRPAPGGGYFYPAKEVEALIRLKADLRKARLISEVPDNWRHWIRERVRDARKYLDEDRREGKTADKARGQLAAIERELDRDDEGPAAGGPAGAGTIDAREARRLTREATRALEAVIPAVAGLVKADVDRAIIRLGALAAMLGDAGQEAQPSITVDSKPEPGPIPGRTLDWKDWMEAKLVQVSIWLDATRRGNPAAPEKGQEILNEMREALRGQNAPMTTRSRYERAVFGMEEAERLASESLPEKTRTVMLRTAEMLVKALGPPECNRAEGMRNPTAQEFTIGAEAIEAEWRRVTRPRSEKGAARIVAHQDDLARRALKLVADIADIVPADMPARKVQQLAIDRAGDLAADLASKLITRDRRAAEAGRRLEAELIGPDPELHVFVMDFAGDTPGRPA